MGLAVAGRVLVQTSGAPSDILWLSSDAPRVGTASRLVNRIPRMVQLSRKQNLAEIGRSWDFVPPTLQLPLGDVPTEGITLTNGHGSHDEALADGGRWGHSRPQLFDWLTKDQQHRGVHLLPQLPQDKASLRTLVEVTLVQRRLQRPMLVAGRAFDVGAYVFVAELGSGSLVYWLHDDLLLRFCSHPYVDASEAVQKYVESEVGESRARALADVGRSWVVGGDYTAAWDLPQGSAMRTALNNRSTSSLQALQSQLGRDRFDQLWERMHRAISTSLAAVNLPNRDRDLPRRDHSEPCDRCMLRFELVRYDFMLDAEADPVLIEVNSGPNLSPSSERHSALLRGVATFASDRR